jgi:hypothetical protein
VTPTGIVAPIVLGLAVPLIIGLFFVLPSVQATIVALLAAELFLPELASFKVPFMPPFDKHTLPYVCILIGCLIRSPKRLLHPPKERWFIWLTLMVVAGGALTGLTNADALSYGKWRVTVLPGLTFKDGMACGLGATFEQALPFFVGYAVFRTSTDLKKLASGFVVAGLVYIPFALVEMRMSPQFHNWVYGYAQHSFAQTLRWGGYRPMVFMAHGLALARFFVLCVLAAFIVSRTKRRFFGVPSRTVGWILFVVLVLCKSTGAIILAILGLPVILWGKTALRQTVAVALASVVFVYPILRANGWFPAAEIVETATGVEKERSESLAYRFANEDILLAKARKRLWFGWGSYGRNMVYNDMGDAVSVSDGAWIVALGVQGLVGYVGMFGTLLVPVFLARKRLRKIREDSDRMLISGVAFALALVAVDLIPNGLFANWPFVLAGALTGVTHALASAPKPEKPVSDALAVVGAGPIR